MTDSILIVGGGVAGLTAAAICAEAGAHAIVVERDAVAGGKLAAAMTDDSSPAATIDGVPVPRFSALSKLDNLEIVTLAELDGFEGRPGNFRATIRERQRFVTDACTRCNRCRPVCPSVSANEYDAGLTYRKAIFSPLPQTLPDIYAIDIESCLNTPPNYLPCDRCMAVCDDDAIHFDLPAVVVHERNVGAVIVTAGPAFADPGNLQDCGYGIHPDVVTTLELQRLLLSPGPTGGFVSRPSNEEYPNSILIIIDELKPFSLYTIASQIRQLVDQDIDRLSLLVTTQANAAGKTSLLRELPAGIDVCWGLLREVKPADDGTIAVSYADFDSNRLPQDNYDMVVLNVEACPPAGIGQLAATLGIGLDDFGYVARPEPATPCVTSLPGVYVAGGAAAPASLPDTVAEARSAAAAALAHLDPRLLRPGYAAPGAVQESAAAGDSAANDELRSRIERALYALLEKNQ